MNECEQILAAQGQVCSMCIDLINGSIVAGIQEFIRYVSSIKLTDIIHRAGASL
jgi:hypothetical protein